MTLQEAEDNLRRYRQTVKTYKEAKGSIDRILWEGMLDSFNYRPLAASIAKWKLRRLNRTPEQADMFLSEINSLITEHRRKLSLKRKEKSQKLIKELMQ